MGGEAEQCARTRARPRAAPTPAAAHAAHLCAPPRRRSRHLPAGLPLLPFVLPLVQDWDWSPAAQDTLLCAYQQEQGNLPARVVLTRCPDREELRQKNLFSVAGTPSLHLSLAAA